MTIFNQDFRTPGSEAITNFDPGQDVIDFTSVNAGRPPEDFQQGVGERARAFNDGLIVNRQGDGVSLVETDGGTLISAGEGNSLFVENVTPDQLSVSNITVDGQAIDISPDSDLQSILDVIAPTGGVNAEGGDGDDNLTGSVGNDTLDGGAGDDVLGSGRGADTLDGGAGDDVLRGGMGDDVLYGGEGNDVLSGDQQDDFLDGGAGDDVLQGGAGSDTLYGGEGDDVLDGGAQRDILKGGAGDDTLAGGAGDDVLTGQEGADTFVQDFSQPGADRITDFNPGQDTINFTGLDNLANISVEEADGGTLINAGPGNSLFVQGVALDQFSVDNITIDGQAVSSGSDGFDLGSVLGDTASGTGALEDEASTGGTSEDSSTVSGALEDEASTGGTSDDALASDDDQTTADNDAEDLVLKGGKGDDILEGGAGDDRLRGGKGDDTLEGGAGDDILKGGKGDDTFVQDFSKPGSDTITDFNPGQDTINFTGLDNLDNVSVEETFGGTVINAGPGNSLFVQGVALDQFSVDNITIDGQAVSSGLGDFDLGSVLGDASSGSSGPDALDFALGKSLDASASQGGAVAESQTAVDALEQAGAVSEAAAAEEPAAEEAVDEAAAG